MYICQVCQVGCPGGFQVKRLNEVELDRALCEALPRARHGARDVADRARHAQARGQGRAGSTPQLSFSMLEVLLA